MTEKLFVPLLKRERVQYWWCEEDEQDLDYYDREACPDCGNKPKQCEAIDVEYVELAVVELKKCVLQNKDPLRPDHIHISQVNRLIDKVFGVKP